MRVRFAPSPTGSLHIGSARTALYNYLYARHTGGVFVLRVEDTDAARSEARFEAAILGDLRWLGLDWDEGPDAGGAYGPYRQSERAAAYREAADGLLASGAAYRCFCPEERLERLREAALAEGRMPKYDGRCRGLSAGDVASRLDAGEPAAVRLAVPEGEIAFDDLIRGRLTFDSSVIGDFIIVRSDGMASYNFAAAVDDRAMRITHVIRGDDHMTNTARQLVALHALGSGPDEVPRYAHHSLVLGADGGKLSKRHGATAVGDYRDAGYLPQAIVNYLALLSWSHGEEEVLDLATLAATFEPAALSSSPAIFDRPKLDWLDHQWIMRLPDDEHERRVAERLPGDTPLQAAAALAAALKPSLTRYDQVPETATQVLERPFGGAGPDPVRDAALVEVLAADPRPLEWFAALRAAAGPHDGFLTPEAASTLLADYRAKGACEGLKARALLMPVRIALTGREHGPELPYVLAAIARDETLARLDAARCWATRPAGAAASVPPPDHQGDPQ